VIVGHHNGVVISREVFAIVGKKIVPTATGKTLLARRALADYAALPERQQGSGAVG
jgi:hypothetical protein